MEPNCGKDDTSKGGTLSKPEPGFDACLLSLTKDDFRNIDTNGSGSLTKNELSSALERDLNPAKKQAIETIAQHVNNSKTEVNDRGAKLELSATLPSWHTTEFSKKQISADDFKLIDSNGDSILDSKELKAATKNPKLDALDKHAASVLGDHLDAAMNDPLLSLKGGVKNWHEHSVLVKPETAAEQSATPGVDIHLDEQVSVSKVDEKGNPTEIETSGSFSKLKYDSNNRITDIETKVAWSSNEKPVTNKVSYDDKNRTQTITTEGGAGEDGSKLTIVNHLDGKGNIIQEDFKGSLYSRPEETGGSVTSTKFDEKGHIKSQTLTSPNGGRVETSVEYNGDSRSRSVSTHYDPNGLKTKESSFDYKSERTIATDFDQMERPTRTIERSGKDKPSVSLREVSYDSNGAFDKVQDTTYEKPFLAKKIEQKDGDLNVVGTIVPEWKMSGHTGQVKAIEYTDSKGNTKTLDQKSQGEDQKLWQELQRKVYKASRIPGAIHHGVDEHSPGKYQLYVPTNAPA